ncbi:hypothetical protein ACFPM0_19350 [Pseudonocardia sulfidoxydans]|uniref:hypothetical protein n=1 Tax=Pseudonocardia sulfidoxydans TaxID=54011 RepID=UPI00361BBFC0
MRSSTAAPSWDGPRRRSLFRADHGRSACPTRPGGSMLRTSPRISVVGLRRHRREGAER